MARNMIKGVAKDGLSILIPVYNEEKIIVKNTERLLKFLGERFGLRGKGEYRKSEYRVPYEIIICDNGSTDSTAEKAEVLTAKHKGRVRFVQFPKRGVGTAFKLLVTSAKFDRLISLDMDLTTDLNFVPRCFRELEKNNIVVGSKIVGSQYRPFFRRLMSNTYILMTKLLLGLDYSDYSIGAKGYRKSGIISSLKHLSNGSFYVTELIYFVKRAGKRVIELPVSCSDTRRSRFNLWNEVGHRLKNILAFWFRMKIAR